MVGKVPLDREDADPSSVGPGLISLTPEHGGRDRQGPGELPLPRGLDQELTSSGAHRNDGREGSSSPLDLSKASRTNFERDIW